MLNIKKLTIIHRQKLDQLTKFIQSERCSIKDNDGALKLNSWHEMPAWKEKIKFINYLNYTINIDHHLFEEIRNNKIINYISYDSKNHSVVANTLFMSLLRRLPSESEINNINTKLCKMTFSEVIDYIKKSNEYLKIGFQNLVP